MSLQLHFHPFASFCQKVLIALYENGTPFRPHLVDLGDEKARGDFQALWPVARMPVLHDDARGRTLPETSIIIEYLGRYYPGPTKLIPDDPDAALETRLLDRIFDLYVSEPMQKIVTDRLRPPGGDDPTGVAQARALLRTAYAVIDERMKARTWAIGDAFTMADCAAAPALFYADWVEPFGDTHPALAAYFARLMKRPSFARAVEEARPYRGNFPKERNS